MKWMQGRQADKLALGVAGLIGFTWAGFTLHNWYATAASGAALLAVLQVLFEVCFAGGESGDAPDPTPPLAKPATFTATERRP